MMIRLRKVRTQRPFKKYWFHANFTQWARLFREVLLQMREVAQQVCIGVCARTLTCLFSFFSCKKGLNFKFMQLHQDYDSFLYKTIISFWKLTFQQLSKFLPFHQQKSEIYGTAKLNNDLFQRRFPKMIKSDYLTSQPNYCLRFAAACRIYLLHDSKQ